MWIIDADKRQRSEGWTRVDPVWAAGWAAPEGQGGFRKAERSEGEVVGEEKCGNTPGKMIIYTTFLLGCNWPNERAWGTTVGDKTSWRIRQRCLDKEWGNVEPLKGFGQGWSFEQRDSGRNPEQDGTGLERNRNGRTGGKWPMWRMRGISRLREMHVNRKTHQRPEEEGP